MIKFIQGNCVNKIKDLEDNSIDCVISSPPYFGLRDYGTAQWYGGNPTCNHKVGRFEYKVSKKQSSNQASAGHQAREKCPKCNAKRIDEQFGLEKTYHDYLANTVKVFETFKPKLKDTATIWWNVGDSYHNYRPTNNKQGMYKKPDYPKQSIAGNRQDLPKHSLKRNQRYQEIKEKDLMMIPNRVAIALQDAGWYIRSEIIWHKPNPMPESVRDRPTSAHEKIWLITKNKKYYYNADAIKENSIYAPNKTHEKERPKGYYKGKWSSPEKGSRHDGSFKAIREKRNKRNVWTVTTKPFKEAHFATFPKDLIEPCIKAGCPENGIVLDPFGGAGTTGIVAKSLNRQCILIELNPEYIKIAKKRADKEFGLFNES
tara:strand:- start:348 stop:1463 length:1116 start_codon:yes stop_codon:yes gene_type:complete